jgi:hypothetical protein
LREEAAYLGSGFTSLIHLFSPGRCGVARLGHRHPESGLCPGARHHGRRRVEGLRSHGTRHP